MSDLPALPLPEDSAKADQSACGSTHRLPQWNSADLLRGNKEVFIQHGEELYRLRLTRQGKLILYK